MTPTSLNSAIEQSKKRHQNREREHLVLINRLRELYSFLQL